MSSELTINEKYLLHIIIDYQRRGKLFFYSNNKIADVLELKKSSISNIVSKLIKLGYIEKNKLSDGKRVLSYTHKPFQPLSIYPVQKYIDLKNENQKIPELEKQISELKKRILFLETENNNLLKQIEKQ